VESNEVTAVACGSHHMISLGSHFQQAIDSDQKKSSP